MTLCEWLPLVPVIVIRAGARRCPTALVVSVRIDVDAVGLGEKEIDIPRGGVLFASATWPEKPPLPVIVTVKVVEPVAGNRRRAWARR